MLGKNIFVKADDVYEVMVSRKECYDPIDNPSKGCYGDAVRPMLILLNATELTLDRKGRIIAVEQHDKLGLWKEILKGHVEEKTKKEKALRVTQIF